MEPLLRASAPGSLLTTQFLSRSGVLVTVLAADLAHQFPSDFVSLEVEAVPEPPIQCWGLWCAGLAAR